MQDVGESEQIYFLKYLIHFYRQNKEQPIIMKLNITGDFTKLLDKSNELLKRISVNKIKIVYV